MSGKVSAEARARYRENFYRRRTEARAKARAKGNCGSCMWRKAMPERKLCEVCVGFAARGGKSKSPETRFVEQYVPLDELHQQPRIHMLRILRYRDWVDAYEIRDLLGLRLDYTTGNTYTAALIRLVRGGQVEQDKRWSPYRYRITKAGCAMLRDELAKAEPVTGPDDRLERAA